MLLQALTHFFQPSIILREIKKRQDVDKMDFKKYMSKDDYANYITLFEDSGWKHISGSLWGGLHSSKNKA